MNKASIAKLTQRKVHLAIHNGKLSKPDKCEKCSRVYKNLHGHHKDYSKPLEVIWLCPACHAAEHKRIFPSESPIARRFQEERLRLFATQKEAAEAIGVTVGNISHWETGKRPVPAYAWIILDCLRKTAECA